MTANLSIGLFLLCVVVYVAGCELGRLRHMRRLNDRLTCERNRNRFGELRTELVRRAVEGEVEPRSPVFVTMYQALTVLMRNPHDYDEAARVILATLPEPQGSRGGLRPTMAEARLAEEVARRFDLLCRDYIGMYRVGAWLLDRLPREVAPPLWTFVRRAQGRRATSIVETRAARARLVKTAKLAAA